MGLRMLQRAVESGIPFGWVTADEVYGQTSRLWLEERDIAHVLAVPKSQMVMTMEFFGQARARADQSVTTPRPTAAPPASTNDPDDHPTSKSQPG